MKRRTFIFGSVLAVPLAAFSSLILKKNELEVVVSGANQPECNGSFVAPEGYKEDQVFYFKAANTNSGPVVDLPFMG